MIFVSNTAAAGLTWEDVDRCREMASAPGHMWLTPEGDHVPNPAWTSLADRIAALLPPRV